MEFKEQVKKGFASCKQDISALQEQNDTLSSKVNHLEQENKQLQNQLNQMQDTLEEIKNSLQKSSLDSSQAPPETQSQAQEPMATGSQAGTQQQAQAPMTTQAQPQSQQQQAPSHNIQDPYEALLAFKAKANKKEVLKQKMTSMIGDMGMNLSELKFMFVDHFRYCSKATFYNYLKELELERQVRIERYQSKNIIFLEGMKNQI